MIVREATSADVESMVAIIGELEFSVDAHGVSARLEALSAAGEPVLLAEDEEDIVGLLDWHVMTTIHRHRPVGRIVALVVADGHRGLGIGKALMAEAERRMRARGCEKLEVTSNMRLSPAHRFYERLGLERTSFRFAKDL